MVEPNSKIMQDINESMRKTENRIGLIVCAALVGILSAISLIYLYAISLNSTRSDWDFKEIFMLLFATNLIFGIAIVCIIVALVGKLNANK